MTKEFDHNEIPIKHGVIFAIINEEGRILLENRSNDPKDQYFGYTIIPGGGIEEDEEVEDALLREVREERDVTPTEYRKTGIVEEVRGGGAVVLKHIFLITDFEGTVVNKEGMNKQFWATMEEAEKLCEHPISKKILASVKESITEGGK
jgi:8-oxo-dGTP pyrophosphatase MutT (NUDIX family)